jgi:hypothetical protein
MGDCVRIDTTQIAKLLEISDDSARRLCERGLLKTARRKTPGLRGSPWTAEQSEVQQMRDRSQLAQVG